MPRAGDWAEARGQPGVRLQAQVDSNHGSERVKNDAAGTAPVYDPSCLPQPLDMLGCAGRRNCNVHLDDPGRIVQT